MSHEQAVRARYTHGAETVEAALCCPVSYDAELLARLPEEVIAKDYGCGDPSRYVRRGDTVLDLGCGAGKQCYIAAQQVGREGAVIGVDMNDAMLAIARKYQDVMSAECGGVRLQFLKGYIQDLSLDVTAMEHWLAVHPVHNAADLAALHAWQAHARRTAPLIADAAVDLVISNCVLNLVDDAQKSPLVREIYRVLKPGGRIAISDIVADQAVPSHLKDDPTLWSGCLSGAFHEQEFLAAFQAAGFVALRIARRDTQPWREIEGIAFRALTLCAVKPEGGACDEQGHSVIYRGPYAEVRDEADHVFRRGVAHAVCAPSYRLLTQEPYGTDFIGIDPAAESAPCAPDAAGCCG